MIPTAPHDAMIRRALLPLLAFVLAAASVAAEGLPPCPAADRVRTEALYGEAKAALNERYDEPTARAAVAMLDEAVTLCPGWDAAWVYLSEEAWNVGDALPAKAKAEKMAWFRKGEAAGDRALAIDPSSAGGLYWKTTNTAGIADVKGWMSSLWLFPTLRANMNRVDALDPHYYHGIVARFWCAVFDRVPLFLADRFGVNVDDLVARAEGEIRREPRYFSNHVYLARLLAKRKDQGRALASLEYVLSHDPAALPDEKGDNAFEQGNARVAWKQITGKDYPAR